MAKQNFEKKSDKIRTAFQEALQKQPAKFKRDIDLSWSNWGFGLEPLQVVTVGRNGESHG